MIRRCRPLLPSPTFTRSRARSRPRSLLGFDLVGIAPAGPSAYRDYFRQWLDDGRAGQMHYLHRRFDERTDPGRLLDGARAVVCVAMNYHVPIERSSLLGEVASLGTRSATTITS
jgi:epoxyqueuosine reductase QueG